MDERGSNVILVIEDDARIAGLVAQVLREAGHTPVLVRDVDAARAWRDRAPFPGAVLSDLMVAGSSDPALLSRELAAIFPGVPVALMTGVPRNRRATLGVAHDRILEKPFELDALVDLVDQMLEGDEAQPKAPGDGS
ncbi:MAG: response regulator [Pseudomonadota bacterium]